MGKQIYRKAALDRLSSPDQLDQMMQVTAPRGWVALLALFLLLCCAVFWGVFGSIPTKVMGQGILIKTGGVFDIPSLAGGVVRGVYFGPGDRVKKGQVVARLQQRELLSQVEEKRLLLHDQEEEYERVLEHGTKEVQMEKESIAQQRTNIENVMESLQAQIAWQEENRRNQEELVSEGLITRQQLLKTRSELDRTIHERQRLENDLKKLKIRLLKIGEEKARSALAILQNINDTRRKLHLLNEKFKESAKVVSPYTGRVIEAAVEEGMMINQGTPVLFVELTGKRIKNLEAVLYFSEREGKKIKQGMKVQISPATVAKEEYGFLLGIVTDTADYPSTPQAMMKTLKNQNLVKSLAGEGAAISINADLIPTPYTTSGYKWSSPQGPPISLDTGTVCSATVTVSELRPIELIVPFFKRHILGVEN